MYFKMGWYAVFWDTLYRALYLITLLKVFQVLYDTWACDSPGGPVKYDIVHMRDQAFSKQPLVWLFLPKNDP